MEELKIFRNSEFGEIRTVIIDNEPWFVGRDVATNLGYVKPETAIRNNVDKGDTLKQGISDANNHMQQMLVINEAGMYALIFGSKLESAKRFKKWVTSEVLPSIRKTGSYQISKDPMKLLELHYEALKKVNQKVDHTEQRINELDKKLQSELSELPILGIESDKITTAARRKGVYVLGGKESAAYNNKGLRAKVYNNIYSNLKYNFGGIKTYKAIKRNQCDKALDIIERYELPVFLQDEVDAENAQMSLNLKEGAYHE